MIRYFASIGIGKIVLWCYLIWYLVNATLVFPTDPAVLTRAVSACAGFVAACAVLRLAAGASRREA